MEYVRRRNKEITHYGHLIRQPTAATFCPCLGDADRVRFANRSIPHWRRLIKHTSADCIDKISPSVLMQLFIFMKRWHLASLLQREKVARFTATDEVLL